MGTKLLFVVATNIGVEGRVKLLPAWPIMLTQDRCLQKVLSPVKQDWGLLKIV
jgi:hypothetical protein